jgi:hypothetical protein
MLPDMFLARWTLLAISCCALLLCQNSAHGQQQQNRKTTVNSTGVATPERSIDLAEANKLVSTQDADLRLSAVAALLYSNNAEVRRFVTEKALASDERILRILGLRAVFLQRRTFVMDLGEGIRNDGRTGVQYPPGTKLTWEFTELDEENGQLLRRRHPRSTTTSHEVRVSGLQVSFWDSYGQRAIFFLRENGKLSGMFRAGSEIYRANLQLPN